jgi:hypothetical protein
VAAEQSGFDVNSHHTVFSGTCPGCRSAETRANADRERSRRAIGPERVPHSAATSN